MKYFLDTEFLEGTQKKLFGKTKPTIDLISIGLFAEDGSEYYAISKDFNLKEAWNRHELKPDIDNGGMKKVYWIRENIMKPIFREWLYEGHAKAKLPLPELNDNQFTYKNFKKFLKYFGKSNKEIADEIKLFTMQYSENKNEIWDKPEFYTYYGAYDWVVFCWLFGKMIDLPKGFPMYSKDLKQILDEKVSVFCAKEIQDTSFESAVKRIKIHKDYPKQTNEHNALADAKWNHELYKFLTKKL